MSGSDAKLSHDPFSEIGKEATALSSTLTTLLPQSPLHLPSRKRASVALILRQSTSSPCPIATNLTSLDLLFIQRAPRATDPWSAHIAFPGGRREPSDTSDLHAAIRETREEVGLDLSNPAAYQLLGRLSDRRIRRGGAVSADHGVLCAFVFLQLPSANPILTPQPTEVAAAFWAPLHVLYGRTAKKEHMMTVRVGEGWLGDVREALGLAKMRMPAVDVLPHAMDLVRADGVLAPKVLLWGMTLACIGDLVEAYGGRRVDWPVALPENKVVAWVMGIIAEVLWWLWERASKRDPAERKVVLIKGR